MSNKILIGITQGDTNGIGCEVLIKSLADNRLLDSFVPVVYSSTRILGYYKKTLASVEGFNFHAITDIADVRPHMVNVLQCVPDNLAIEPGVPTEDGAKAALLALQAAVRDLREKRIQALVTGPFNKRTVNDKGFAFPGHTEFLANAFAHVEPLMLMCGEGLRVGVATGHIPLEQVPSVLSPELILRKLRIFDQSLKQDFNLRKPKIAVLGLNPHAGENGLLGSQESKVIAPALEAADKEGILAFGPFPADGFFASASYRRFDGVLAMYHDQGLLPFKTLFFNEGVNFTAGLPVVRTSPDHGTAYDLVGKDKASNTSFLNALYLALDICRSRERGRELAAHALRIERLPEGHES